MHYPLKSKEIMIEPSLKIFIFILLVWNRVFEEVLTMICWQKAFLTGFTCLTDCLFDWLSVWTNAGAQRQTKFWRGTGKGYCLQGIWNESTLCVHFWTRGMYPFLCEEGCQSLVVKTVPLHKRQHEMFEDHNVLDQPHTTLCKGVYYFIVGQTTQLSISQFSMF